MRIFVLGNCHRPGVHEEAEAPAAVPARARRNRPVRPLSGTRPHRSVRRPHPRPRRRRRHPPRRPPDGLSADARPRRQPRQARLPRRPQPRRAAPLLSRPSPAASIRVTQHLMFECLIDGAGERRTFLGLNEIAVQTAPPFHMMELDLDRGRRTGVALQRRRPDRLHADRLDGPQPLGRRSHPRPGLAAFVVTPICPHTLTNRPVVDSADKVYTISVRRRRRRHPGDRRPGTRARSPWGSTITVRRAPVTFGLVKVAGRSYYQTLRDKLHWGEQPNYRDEPSAGA